MDGCIITVVYPICFKEWGGSAAVSVLLCGYINLLIPSIFLTPFPPPEMQQLRVTQKTQGRSAKLGRIKIVRKSIARVLTVYNQEQKSSVSQKLK